MQQNPMELFQKEAPEVAAAFNNLILSFEKLGYTQKITRMKDLLRVMES